MRKYLHWGETREVPKAPIPTLTPLNSFDTPLYPSPKPEHVATDIRKLAEELRSVGMMLIEDRPSDSDAAREAREQSRRVLNRTA
jgi:hypothetical protein